MSSDNSQASPSPAPKNPTAPAPVKPNLPPGHHAITKEDKASIRELGAAMDQFLQEYFKDKEDVPFKIIIGACQYVIDLQNNRIDVLGAKYMRVVTFAKATNEKVTEPFPDDVEAPQPTDHLPAKK